MGEILVHILLGLLDRYADVLGQREGRDAIHNAEIHRFGRAAHGGGDLLGPDTKDLGGGDGVDVGSALKAVDHSRIAGHMGQEPQLDLGIIRIHQHTAGRGREHLAQLGPQLGADGNVLKVGFSGGQPPSGGHRILERGAEPPVRTDDLGQTVHIGGLQLGELAVLQNLVNDGVLAPQLVQHLGIGGPAGFGLFHRWEPQRFK